MAVSGMEQYLARQIMMDKLDYNKVVKKYPQHQDNIDIILDKNGVLKKYKK